VAPTKLLLVDDDETIRFTHDIILTTHGFEVTVAATVTEALKHISSEVFDVLLSDLHMPGAGDGLTVVSAMRHSNPKAVTILFSSFPHMDAAAQAILMQTDEILVKPMNVDMLVDAVRQRLAAGPSRTRVVESVAAILERSATSTISDWYELVKEEASLMAVPMSFELRSGHLPQVIQDLVLRLRSSKTLGTKELFSEAATEHGTARRQEGYTAAMMVEESRILQVSVFNTLQKNLASIDFSVVLIGVMTIADEIDSQLGQAMKSYLAESIVDALPA
jgi:DNA-binding response OmpR family regulator